MCLPNMVIFSFILLSHVFLHSKLSSNGGCYDYSNGMKRIYLGVSTMFRYLTYVNRWQHWSLPRFMLGTLMNCIYFLKMIFSIVSVA